MPDQNVLIEIVQKIVEEVVPDKIILFGSRAKSNLKRARAGKGSEEILYEDLCFDAQQATGKYLKALLVKLAENVFGWANKIIKPSKEK